MMTPFVPSPIAAASRQHARDAFVALVNAHGEQLPLGKAAAWMCAEERALATIAPMLEALSALTSGLFIPDHASTIEGVARLNHRLFTELGFQGDLDDFDHPDNSLLDTVLSRRKGLPILLSLVLLESASASQIPMNGIGFPTHFLVAPPTATPQFFIGPFNGGRILRRGQLHAWFQRISTRSNNRMPPFSWWLQPISNRKILMRMNNNLKGSYLRRNDLDGALRCVERLLVLSPDAIEARRDRGLLRFELGQEEEGAKDLDAYLAARHCDGLQLD